MSSQDILDRSLQGCRMPLWRRGEKSAAEKIEDLEEYILMTAFYRGELAEERNREEAALDDLDDRYAAIDIEWTAQGKPRTDKGVEAAKYDADPDTCRARTASQKRVKRLTAEMERLDRDATICSRAYTFITGS